MDGKERRLTLAKLREARNYWSKKAYEKRNINNEVMPNNVVQFPGNPNINSITQQKDGGTEMGYVNSMGTHPGVGNLSYKEDINQLPKAGFASGLILAGITFVTELLFLAVSYFMFK